MTTGDPDFNPTPSFAIEMNSDLAIRDGHIDRTADAPIVQVFPDEILYRASSVGSCPRKLWAARSGMEAKPTTAKMQAIFDRGHELEPIILKALQDKGWELRNYQGEVLFQVVTLPSGLILSIIGHYDCEARFPVSGHDPNYPDMVFWSDWFPCDVKGFGPELISEYLSHGLDNLPHYQWQQSIYVLGHDTAKAFLMPIWDKDKNELLQSSLYPRIPDITLPQIEQKLLSVELAYVNSDMPECTNDFPCPYYYLHDDAPDNDILPLEAIQFIVARMNAEKKIKVFQMAKDVMTEQLLKVLPSGFKGDYEGASISVQENPDRFNTAAAKRLLQEAGFDIDSSEFKIPGVGHKLVIVPPK